MDSAKSTDLYINLLAANSSLLIIEIEYFLFKKKINFQIVVNDQSSEETL